MLKKTKRNTWVFLLEHFIELKPLFLMSEVLLHYFFILKRTVSAVQLQAKELWLVSGSSTEYFTLTAYFYFTLFPELDTVYNERRVEKLWSSTVWNIYCCTLTFGFLIRRRIRRILVPTFSFFLSSSSSSSFRSDFF